MTRAEIEALLAELDARSDGYSRSAATALRQLLDECEQLADRVTDLESDARQYDGMIVYERARIAELEAQNDALANGHRITLVQNAELERERDVARETLRVTAEGKVYTALADRVIDGEESARLILSACDEIERLQDDWWQNIAGPVANIRAAARALVGGMGGEEPCQMCGENWCDCDR